MTENEGQLTVYADELAGLEDVAALRAESGEQRRVLAERRTALAEARSEHDRLRREADARRERLAAIVRERASWVERDGRATARLAELAERRDAEARELGRLAARPAEIAEQREQLAALIAESEARRKEAADRLAVAETALAEVERESREVERVLAAAREDRVRAEAALEQANRGLAELKDRIAERLECRPEEILEQAGIAPDEVLPEGAEVRERHDGLVALRERLGPVNLRAEQEVAEIEARIEGMERERDDLTGAIAKLRSAIARLNREGRERLLASFEMVNAHFQELFVRVFGGGRAHLTLVEDDDPLDAGLEIMASPPGKKLQVMSLLSGGEQALTALALVFAAFLTNPSPICVLDEVDAPLDDANVDRFCSLLDDITEKTGTRFLVITHHRLTMARMDRLFGVTMSERGISQLVSVDLTRAERLRESA